MTENLLRDQAGCATCPNQPKPKRVYDGLELRLQKRLDNNWYANVNYTFSRLYGNYSGLASSDENGRNAPSVNRFFDGQYMSFDQNGNPVFGDLGTDRPHQFEVQGGYQFKWGTDVGAYYLLGTALPQSSTITVGGVPVYYLGRGDLGRTPTFSQTDLNIMQAVKLFGRIRFTGRDEHHQPVRPEDRDRDRCRPLARCHPGDADAVLRGFNTDAVVAATPSIRPDPRFNLPNAFQGDRRIRVAAKFRF